MIFGLGAVLIILLIYGPFLWVRYVMRKHARDLPGMPGTGGELASHLVDRFQLDGVQVVVGTEGQDHYDHENRRVSLSPSVFEGQSLTAVAIAAHEVGHAIQFSRNEPVSRLRTKYLGLAFTLKRIGIGTLVIMPVVLMAIKTPVLILLTTALGIATMLASALTYIAILPEEFDASFNKALPILKEGYVPEEYLPAVEQVLKAAALTYFAGALADTLNLWRWLSVFR